MNDTSTPQDPQDLGPAMTSEAPPPVEALSVTDKFIGVLTEPAATYENVKAAGARASDWLIPVILLVIILGGGTFIRFSNPEFVAKIMEQQSVEMQKRVDSGEWTQEQADQAVSQMENFKGFMRIGGTISAAVGFFIFFFIFAGLYWLIVRFIMKGETTFSLILAALGLAGYINALDQLVSLLLTFVTGAPFANLSPALFMDADVQATSTRILMLLNPLAIWATYVMAIGFEKVASISRTKAMIAAFGLWLLFNLGGALLGFGAGMG